MSFKELIINYKCCQDGYFCCISENKNRYENIWDFPFLKGNFNYIYYMKHSSTHITWLSGEFFGLYLFQFGNVSCRFLSQAADLIISVITIGINSFHQINQNTLFSRLTCGEATVIHIFLWTSDPSLAFPVIMQYGTFILWHGEGIYYFLRCQEKSLKQRQKTCERNSFILFRNLSHFEIPSEASFSNFNIH